MNTTHISNAAVANWIQSKGNAFWLNLISIGAGVGLITILAQVKIPLPFSPVPITGQTFGVTLVALLWGRNRGFSTVAAYLTLGFLGAPVFTSPMGLIWGPTLGYLIGMLAASYVVGSLADRGWGQSFPSAFLAHLAGSALVFTCGLTVLSYFVPSNDLLMAGIVPFIPGDLLKGSLAAWIVYSVNKKSGTLPKKDLYSN